jgi:osmotically inducible lipoprotein OsmB
MKAAMTLLICGVFLAGCSGMSDTQQRALSGTAIGAGGGAILGAIGGNAALGAVAGAGAGLVGGLIYDKVKKNEQAQYNQGYSAGKQAAASGH